MSGMDHSTIISIRRQMERDGIDPAMPADYGHVQCMVTALSENIAALQKRIGELEKALAGQQKKLDHTESHALSFRGAWQAAERYYPGNVVRYMEGVYTALKDISPGKAEPGRNGSGWDRIF